MNVEDIVRQIIVIFEIRYSITDKTISGVQVSPGSAEILVRNK